MATFELKPNSMLTKEETTLLEEAKKVPVTFDEDSPQLTKEMKEAFIAARKAKPFRNPA